MRPLLLLLVLAWTLNSCTRDTIPGPERPHEPWVFRSVLDEKPRMVTVALHDDVWAAYSAETGALYKVWKGSVNFDGAVYTTVHGPQPSTLGDAWFENAHQNPWIAEVNGEQQPVNSRYKGHWFKNGHVWLQYDLTLPNGQTLRMEERPEFVRKGESQVGFERIFKPSAELPEGLKLLYKANYSSIVLENSIETNAPWEILGTEAREGKGLKTIDLDGVLTLNGSGETYLRSWFAAKPMLVNANKVVGAEEAEEQPLGYRLIARSDCKSCHNTYVATIGPSYKDIARRYRNTPENVAMLAGKIKLGGSGVWGSTVMSAHPELNDPDIVAMVEYIMSLDAEEEAAMTEIEAAQVKDGNYTAGDDGVEAGKLLPGAQITVYQYDRPLNLLKDLTPFPAPLFTGIIPQLHAEGGDFMGLENDFAIVAEGYLYVPKSNNYVLRLISDDGSRLILNGEEIITHDGTHGATPRDGEVLLAEGYHPFKVEYFNRSGGKALSLQWRSFNDGEFMVIPPTALLHHSETQAGEPMGGGMRIPGDGYPLEEVHPSYDISQARPDEFLPKVGGMDFLPDGRLVICTWDAAGAVYILDGVQGGDPSKIKVKKIAEGLAEPLGLSVVDGEIFVLQKQELTHLIDHDGDEIIDEYRTHCNDWKVSANFHEFAFGLAYKDDYFYAALAIAILPGGASAQPQIPDRGKVVRISRADGSLEFFSEGLRTPNGLGIGVDGEIFLADNQGDWLPSSKIVHIQKGGFYGSRAVDPEGTASMQEIQPLVWLPQDEIGNSPSTPSWLNDGPYKGQMIHGEVTHGGVKRVFVEQVDGQYQGALFRFIQGLEAGVNRLVWGPDGALYIGGIGSSGNWRQNGKLWYGLQRLKYNGKPCFEMLAVRAMSNGMEIEFTEPLPEHVGWKAAEYDVQQWRYQPTADYGGPKMDFRNLSVRSANVSEDRRKVFLELDGMKAGHVVYIRIPFDWTSEAGNALWATEVWYTLNAIPQGKAGFRTQAPPMPAPNTLTKAEEAAGWRLLFDGQTTKGWRNYRKESIGSSWKVVNGALMLDAQKDPNGGWQAKDGGDIVFEDEFENFELRLEWKIMPCGNSGIMYLVHESDAYDYPWMTGPEMQVLDNTCHPDARIDKHRAGDLYDLIACQYETVKPAGSWNSVRLIKQGDRVEHWLNGRKVVAFTMGDKAWKEMLANSKWKDFSDFGTYRKGRIALQDHGDVVWFRNIKVREL